MDKFNEVVQSTMRQYDETLKKLADGESAKTELLVRDLEELFDLESSGLSGLSRVGVELVDKKTKERICYIANSAWVNSEWDELTITVDVDKIPKVEE